jgi:hypothetical protein
MLLLLNTVHQNHMHLEDSSIQVSCSNILKNLDWIISYGDVVNNHKTSQALDAIERFVQEKKNKVMKDVLNSLMDLQEGSVDWPGICTRKRKPIQRLKGVAG